MEVPFRPGNCLMTLWFVFALMTVAAIFAVLWPLSRGAASKAGGSEAVVYKDQLAEIDRDVAAGQIGVSEAEAARVEISRRLLAAADSERDLPARSNPGLRRSSAVLALVGLPIAAVALYLSLGSPQLGDFPLAERTRAADANQPLENLVAQVEAHLEKNPTDGRGWSVLAPVLARLGRFDDAVRAFRNSIAYNGDSAERRSDLGEALAGSAGGVVTADAKAEFERAAALNASDPKANYFLGLAAEQAGRCAVAAAGAGRAGPGRRPGAACAVERNDGRGQGHDRGRPWRNDPRYGRPPRHQAETERRRRRGMAAAGAGLYGDG